MRKSLFVLLLLVIFTKSVMGQEPRTSTANRPDLPQGMSKGEFASYLQSLRTALPKWREAISKVDVSTLHLIEYGEGKSIEAQQNLCSSWLDEVSKGISLLEQKPSITGLVNLLVTLDDFEGSLNALMSSIGIRAFPDITAQDIPKTGPWQKGLFEVLKACNSFRKQLLGQVIAVTIAADVLLGSGACH